MNKQNLNTEKLNISENEKFPVDCLVGLPPLQLNGIYNGDSFELCKRVPAKADLILEDMPYNTTACDWDKEPIDLKRYWESRMELIKPTGVICLTASQPFTSKLVMSNNKMFKYEMIWDKVNKYTGFMNARIRPLKRHESVLIFTAGGNTYNAQKEKVKPYKSRRSKTKDSDTQGTNAVDYGRIINEKNPSSILQFEGNITNGCMHPTQKPVGLFEYLIKTYTNEGELVFDGFGGSGTTAIASHRTKRNFIVIEKEKKYFDLAKRRLDIERAQLTML